MKFTLIAFLALSVPAFACPPGSRCIGEPSGDSELSQLSGCKDMKKVKKIRDADSASRKALKLLAQASDDADIYKADCDAPATQDTDKLRRIYQEGNTAGDTSGRARQATDEAKALLNEIARPLNDLGMQECISSLSDTNKKINEAKASLDTKGAALGKCGATAGTSAPDNRPARDTYDARWCGIGGCEQGSDGKWRVKSGR